VVNQDPSKSLIYAVAPVLVTVKDILCDAEKAIGTLPEENSAGDCQNLQKLPSTKDNLTDVDRRAPRSLKANEALIVLSADMDNSIVVLGTSDYDQKITTLLEDNAYKKPKKDPMDFVGCNTVVLLKKSPD
jgi:hypothetical protein